MDDCCVLCEVRDNIRILTINRPAQQNKLDIACMDKLTTLLQEAEADESCRVVVLTGVGDYFCSGGELGDYRFKSSVDIRRFGRTFIKLHSAISNLEKPVLAAVQGDVFGGGMSILEACDLAVAVEDAKFGTPEITTGIAPMMALAGVVRVADRKGAMQMALLGEAIDAKKALAVGWINWVCPRSELMQTMFEIADNIAARNPVAVSHCKKLYGQIGANHYENQLEAGLGMLVSLLKSDDAAEALRARQNQTQPQWRNR
jgi:enoyl-CoA hydratase/carnithine racemase